MRPIKILFPLFIFAAALAGCMQKNGAPIGQNYDPLTCTCTCSDDAGVPPKPADMAMAVRDLTPPADLTPPPDLWAPTCKYHWVPIEPGGPFNRPFSWSKTTRYGQSKFDYESQLFASLMAIPDPSNPPYVFVIGNPDQVPHSMNPHFIFSVDVIAHNMPRLQLKNISAGRPGQINIFLQMGKVPYLPMTSPQSTADDQRMDPGHYEFDWSTPGDMEGGPLLDFETVNMDSLDTMGWVETIYTFKDVTTIQPCNGALPVAYEYHRHT